jgi:hypothetical protein
MIDVIWKFCLAVQGHILCHDCPDFRIHVLLQNHQQNTIKNYYLYAINKTQQSKHVLGKTLRFDAIEIYHLAPNNITKIRECRRAYPNSIFVHKESPSSNHTQSNQNDPKSSPTRFCLTGSFTCRLSSSVLQQEHVNVGASKNINCIQLTYAGIMVLDIQKISATTAVIAAPSIFAATFRTLTSFLLFAFINVCQDNTEERSSTYEYQIFYSGKHSPGIIQFTMLVQTHGLRRLCSYLTGDIKFNRSLSNCETNKEDNTYFGQKREEDNSIQVPA